MRMCHKLYLAKVLLSLQKKKLIILHSTMCNRVYIKQFSTLLQTKNLGETKILRRMKSEIFK